MNTNKLDVADAIIDLVHKHHERATPIRAIGLNRRDFDALVAQMHGKPVTIGDDDDPIDTLALATAGGVVNVCPNDALAEGDAMANSVVHRLCTSSTPLT